MRTNKLIMVFGTFDTVHFGHTALIEYANARGRVLGVVGRDATVAVVKQRKVLHTERDRLHNMRSLFPECQFVLGSRYDHIALVKKHKPDVVVLGYDQHVFVPELMLSIHKHKLKTEVLRAPSFNPQVHKSSKLSPGTIFVRGKVGRGKGEGRKLGFPTANIRLNTEQKKIVKKLHGVYAGRAFVRGVEYRAAIVCGMRTVRGAPLIEAYLIGASGNFYEQRLALMIQDKIRPLVWFSDRDALIAQIREDVVRIKSTCEHL